MDAIARRLARRSDRDRPARRHAHGPGARRGRARPLLPGRPRSGRHARRDGGDERGRDDDGALREDARERARARGRARGRPRRPRRQPRAEDLRRLRPARPPDRLRGNARRDHRADAAAPGDSRAGGRPAALVPRRRVRVPCRHGDRRRGGGRHPRSSCSTAGRSRRSTTTGARTSRSGRRSSSRRPGSAGTVASDLELVAAIAESEGSLDIVAERDPTARSRLWAARHASAYAVAAASPGKRHRSTDVCVPLSELAGAVSFARAELERRGLVAGIVGHAGDGNVHLSLMVDPDDEAELRASRRADRGARDRRARARRYLHRRARHRPRQDPRAGARARRPGAAHAGRQAGVRPERDHESREGAARAAGGARHVAPRPRRRRARRPPSAWTRTAATTIAPPASVAAHGRSS